MKGFDDPYLGVESPMVVEAQDLLYLSPISWDQAMIVYGNCLAKSNWAGQGEEWQETGWCVWTEGGKSRELEIEGSKFKILEG